MRLVTEVVIENLFQLQLKNSYNNRFPFHFPDCVNVARQIEINNCTASNGFFSFRNNSCLWPPQSVGYADDSSAYNATSFGPSYWIASTLNATNSSLLENFLGSIVPKTPSEEYF